VLILIKIAISGGLLLENEIDVNICGRLLYTYKTYVHEVEKLYVGIYKIQMYAMHSHTTRCFIFFFFEGNANKCF